MASYQDPTTEEAIALFKAVEERFPSDSLGTEKWYLVALSDQKSNTDHVGTLYSYLIAKPEYESSEARKVLIRRLREALVKNVSLLGVCRPLEAIFAIVKLERPEDRDDSYSREHWKSGAENSKRGQDWLNVLYKENLSVATDNFAYHRDFDFISRQITYGLYLSDHSILSPVETELVVLSGIMIQNMASGTAWHLRGMRRIGVSLEALETIQDCIKLIGAFGGARLHKVPRARDIEHEV